MKRILLAGIAALFLMSASFASEIGMSVDKQVNGSWKEALIVNFALGTSYQAYLNTSAIFIAPRADMSKPNHECFEAVIGGRFALPTGATLDLNTGSRYWWAGNSQGNPGGQIDWTSGGKLSWIF